MFPWLTIVALVCGLGSAQLNEELASGVGSSEDIVITFLVENWIYFVVGVLGLLTLIVGALAGSLGFQRLKACILGHRKLAKPITPLRRL